MFKIKRGIVDGSANNGVGCLMRMNNIYREKLVNAILYFAQQVKYPNVLKICKLLYLFDFTHFKQTGRSVTNLDYYAYEMGPLPKTLYEGEGLRQKQLPRDFQKYLALVPFRSTTKEGATFRAKIDPDMSVFTPREQRILANLAFIYKDADAKTMSDVSHLKNHPWDVTFRKKKYSKIEYELAIDDEAGVSLEQAREALQEREETLRAFPPMTEI